MPHEDIPEALAKEDAILQELFEKIKAKAAANDPTVKTDLLRYSALSDQFQAKFNDELINLLFKKFELDIVVGSMEEARDCYVKIMELDPKAPGQKLRKAVLQKRGISVPDKLP